MEILTVELEGLPPSVNGMYVRKRRNVYKDRKARDWQDQAVRKLKEEWEGKPALNCALELRIEYTTSDHRRWDIDNRVKALQDTLETADVITDDRLIEKLQVKRKYGKTTATRITLVSYGDENETER